MRQTSWLGGLYWQLLNRPTRKVIGRSRTKMSAKVAAIIEPLEVRRLLTVNIAVTGVSLVDSNNNPLASVTAGQDAYVHVDFTTTNLPANASYSISFTVNGFTLNTGPETSGAGQSGSSNWYFYWGSFAITPGANQITVNVDPAQSVAESSYADNSMSINVNGALPTVGNLSYSVSQIRSAYGLNSLSTFGGATADGTGQTIAIIDEFNDPTVYSDLDQFDQSMNISSNSSPTLYQSYGASSSFLTVYSQSGVNISSQVANSGQGSVPSVDPTGAWEGEETLDVQWAHAIAPGAKIDLIETTGSGNGGGLYAGTIEAASLPGVSVVSMSWSFNDSSGEQTLDSSTFVTPNGHTGVTFLASAGDGGAPGGYPAFSPNVIAVGGTALTTNGNAYGSETAWSFPTPRTLNNGGTSYSQTGTWSTQTGGFSGNYSTASAGASSSATWTTPITSSDQGWVNGTEVSATWVAASGNATNAKYLIYDGTSTTGTLLGTVTVNQTKAPVGTADGNTQFQELGDYFPTSGKITVVLSASTANGKVSADAIGIAPGWATGGGQSQYETAPSYQSSVQSTGFRTSPDVSFDGASTTGVTAWQGGQGFDYYGTSLSCPCWAGIIAIVDQGRVALGVGVLNSSSSPTQALQDIYGLPNADFNDITTGYNGLSAGTGYDELTGRGSPIANLLIPDMVAYGIPPTLNVTVQPASSITAGAAFTVQVTIENESGTVDTAFTGAVTISIATEPGAATLNGTLTVNAVNGVATFSPNIAVVGSGYSLSVSASGFTSITTTTFAITPATPNVAVTDAGGVYTGNPFPATVTATGIGGVTVTGTTVFTYYTGSSVSGPGSTTAPTAVGTYTVVGAFTSSNPNYSNASSAPLTFSIETVAPPIVASVYDATGTNQITAGNTLTSSIAALTFNFSEILNVTNGGANSVTNPSNWLLLRYGADVSNLISGITFAVNSTSPKYVATVSFSSPLIQGGYLLIARQNIQDGTGRALAGGGGSFSSDFRFNFYVAQTVGQTTDIAPVLYNIEPATLSAVGSLTTPITSTLYVFDADSNNWSSATIQIAINYQSSEDVLGFTNTATPNITASWNAANGTLTLSGTDTVSDYRTALHNVTYHDSSATPNTALTRTIYFQANDGLLLSDVVTRDMTVQASSTPAVLSGVAGTGLYDENDPPLAIVGGIVITDPSTVYLTTATVSFTNWQGEDRFNFNNIFALQWTFNQNLVANTATFTITATDFVDHYQTLLRSVVYWDVSPNPITTPRVATVTVSDGLSTSNAVTRNTITAAVNQPPTLTSIESTPLAYKANDPAYPPQPISNTLLVGDPDSNNLSKATVTISSGYEHDANGTDVLSFVNQNGITGSWNAATGTLTLTGDIYVGYYRLALRSVTFSTSGTNVSTANRTLSIVATDDYSPTTATSLTATRTVAVTAAATNVPPTLGGTASTPLAYVRGATAAAVASAAYVYDPDSVNLASTTIQITSNYQNGLDVLAATTVTGITSSFNASTGMLTLSGVASLASYQTVLQSVTFHTTSGANTSTRTLAFILNDGLANSGTVIRNVTLS